MGVSEKLDTINQFIERFGPENPHLQEARELVRNLSRATLQVRTSPAGALVMVDGQQLGPSPVSVKVSEGEHRVMASLEGLEPTEETVKTSRGVTSVVNLTLVDRRPALLTVNVLPEGSLVKIVDGKGRVKEEKSPLAQEVDAGRYEIEASHPCSGGACVCHTGYAGAECDRCASGYIGYPNCFDDPCYPDPCSGHGTCSGGTCTCNTGYAGTYCNQCDQAYSGYPDCNQCAADAFGEYPYCFLPGAAYCDTSQCFLVPPTNQTHCYNNSGTMTCTAFPCNTDGTPNFCGQDAQYPDNPRVFTCYNASGTVQDPCDSTADDGEAAKCRRC